MVVPTPGALPQTMSWAEALSRPTIVDTAKAARAGLIVMGAFGRNRINEYFLGSNASAVVRTSPVPVLLAPLLLILERVATHSKTRTVSSTSRRRLERSSNWSRSKPLSHRFDLSLTTEHTEDTEKEPLINISRFRVFRDFRG